MKNSLVIGIVGKKGSGKGTISRLLELLAHEEQCSAWRLSFSDALKESLAVFGIEPSVADFQDFAQFMEERFGAGTVAQGARIKAENFRKDIVILDGVRWWPDHELIRGFKHNALIYVTAEPRVRYERAVTRKQRPGDDAKSFDQFMQEEKAGTEINIAGIGARADYTIENNAGINISDKESVRQLEQKVREIFEDILKKRQVPFIGNEE